MAALKTEATCDGCGDAGTVEKWRWCDNCAVAVCADCAIDKHMPPHVLHKLADATAADNADIARRLADAARAVDRCGADLASLRSDGRAIVGEAAALKRQFDTGNNRAGTLLDNTKLGSLELQRLVDDRPLSRQRAAARRNAIDNLAAVQRQALSVCRVFARRGRAVRHARAQLIAQCRLQPDIFDNHAGDVGCGDATDGETFDDASDRSFSLNSADAL